MERGRAFGFESRLFSHGGSWLANGLRAVSAFSWVTTKKRRICIGSWIARSFSHARESRNREIQDGKKLSRSPLVFTLKNASAALVRVCLSNWRTMLTLEFVIDTARL